MFGETFRYSCNKQVREKVYLSKRCSEIEALLRRICITMAAVSYKKNNICNYVSSLNTLQNHDKIEIIRCTLPTCLLQLPIRNFPEKKILLPKCLECSRGLNFETKLG